LPAKAAKAAAHAAGVLADRPLSLASQLLQGTVCGHEIGERHRSGVGAGLPAKAAAYAAGVLADRPLSLASQLLQGTVCGHEIGERHRSGVGAGLPAKAAAHAAGVLADRPPLRLRLMQIKEH